MNKLTIGLISLALFLGNLASAKEEISSRIPFYVLNAASSYGIDAVLMYSICLTESNCKSKAINHNDGTKKQKENGIVAKAYGLFQIQLDTAKSLGFVQLETVTVTKKRGRKLITVTKTIDHTRDLLDPQINSIYAAKLLKKLYKKYHDTKKVVSAYNAGHYTNGNKDYVGTVFTYYAKFKLDKHFY